MYQTNRRTHVRDEYITAVKKRNSTSSHTTNFEGTKTSAECKYLPTKPVREAEEIVPTKENVANHCQQRGKLFYKEKHQQNLNNKTSQRSRRDCLYKRECSRSLSAAWKIILQRETIKKTRAANNSKDFKMQKTTLLIIKCQKLQVLVTNDLSIVKKSSTFLLNF